MALHICGSVFISVTFHIPYQIYTIEQCHTCIHLITVKEYICVKCWYLGMDFLELGTENGAISVLFRSPSDIQMLPIMTLGPFDEYLIKMGDFKVDGNLICD